MAIFIRGTSPREIVDLAMEMADSGQILAIPLPYMSQVAIEEMAVNRRLISDVIIL